ncbi:MAG: DUF4249 domain-containing protein [Bacteroidales bacterium]|nr:DUF4249 domain-containing protein [Bacteroidales bacterium]MBN2749294.1 DUF4249 domain-containing protein [Bacteroidales bacterium]
MKRLKLHIVSILFLSLLMGSCIKDVPDKYVPTAEPKLVVYSFISPSSSRVKAAVYKSTPILGGGGNSMYKDDPVVTALVIVANSKGEEVVLPYSYEESCFLISSETFPVVEGETYTITVSADGFKTAYASTTVPSLVLNAENFSINTSASSFKTNFSFDLLDGDTNRENYYRYFVYGSADENQSSYKQEFILENYLEIASDKNWENNRLKLQFSCDNQGFTMYQLVLFGVNREYFRYFKTHSVYEEENPFAEAQPIYSNITNGIGVFAAYKEKSLWFDAEGKPLERASGKSIVLY